MGGSLPNLRRSARLVGALVLGLLLLGGSQTPDISVRLNQPSHGFAQSLDFKLGTNEIVDLYRDGGIDRASQFGTDLVRVWLGHRFLGSAVGDGRDDLDWSLLYDFVGRVLEAGATPLVSFVAAPAWITAADGRPSSQHESERFNAQGVNAYAAYVAEAIDRLRDQFGPDALSWPYTIWNEPNNHQNAGQHYACGDGSAYAELYGATKAAVADRFGSGVVALGGPSLDAIDTGATLNPDGDRTCGPAPDLDWSAYLRSVDEIAFHDFLTWHWYGMFRTGETTTADVLRTRLAWFEHRVRLISGIAAGRPHYVEEINFNGDLAVDPLVHAPVNGAFLASATLRAVRQGASGMLVYKGTHDPSGLSPRGEPDFGLWSSALADAPAPAFPVMQLMRRFVAGSGRLARVDVRGSDLDALAVVTEQGPRTAVVNLSPDHRVVHLAGLPPAPVATIGGDVPWSLAWFDGATLGIPGYGLAVIDGSLSGLPALPTVERGRQIYHSRCAFCHGATVAGAHAPRLAGSARSNIDTSHVASILTPAERLDLAHFLSGWRDGGRVLIGHVYDRTGGPVSGALVIAAASDSGRAAWTDATGRFELRVASSLSGATAAPVRLMVLHPDHGSADTPTSHGATPTGHVATIVLESALTDQRPVLASSFAIDDGNGIRRIGTSSAGADEVWAVAAGGGVARRLHPKSNSTRGVRETSIAAADDLTRMGHWVIAARGPTGMATFERLSVSPTN